MRILYRHKKRGTEYELIGIGKMQTEDWFKLLPGEGEIDSRDLIDADMQEVAVYRSIIDPKEIWVRPREEFEDGRFEVLFAEDAS